MSGIFQEYAERLRNECGCTKLDSASCPRPSGRHVCDANISHHFLNQELGLIFQMSGREDDLWD